MPLFNKHFTPIDMIVQSICAAIFLFGIIWAVEILGAYFIK